MEWHLQHLTSNFGISGNYHETKSVAMEKVVFTLLWVPQRSTSSMNIPGREEGAEIFIQ